MNRNFTNNEIAELLRQMAAVYEVKDQDRFRVSAYEKAAASIEHLTSEVKDVWDDGKLEDIPAVGKSIASSLDELLRTGKVKHFEKEMKGLPPSMFIFMKVPGIGPKTALALAQKLKIKEAKGALEKLASMAKKGKIRDLENFGEKSESDILSGIETFKKGGAKTTRMLLPYADNLAMEIISYLKQNKAVLEAFPLGSLRRMVSTIGDIDIAASSNNAKEAMAHFLKYPKIKEVVGAGEESLGRVLLQTGQQVDLRISKPENFGSMLQYFTGSKQHNIELRTYALKQEKSLSEYGIKKNQISNIKYQRQSANLKTFKDEEGFYNELGMEWVPPELREGNEEIEKALRQAQGKLPGLPRLVELDDIKGDLHLHSDFPIEPSHDLGASSVEEMVKWAIERDYQYLGFSEHNPALSDHSSGEIIALLKRKKELFEQKKYAYKKRITILNGLEVDIRSNGELSVSDEGLELLDYAIVSVHSSFGMNREEMTKRIIQGLAHPKAKILGHPTGRLLGEREGYEVDWPEVFAFCAKNKKILEISAFSNRLDLPDILVKEAVKSGVKLIINTDSHNVEQMDLMKYGVSVARRGWAERKDIVNTYSFEEMKQELV